MNITKRARTPLTIAATLFYVLNAAGCGYAQPTQTQKKEQRDSRLEETLKQEYNTVDDILGDSFEPISSDDFYEKTSKGKCVVMFYDSKKVNGYSGRLAKVFKAVAPEFKDNIVFYKLDANLDKTFFGEGDIRLKRKAFLKKYDIKGIPYFIFFKGGESVFEVDGGPKVGEEHFWVEGIPKDIKKHFYSDSK
jgi:thioredoxin-related protein